VAIASDYPTFRAVASGSSSCRDPDDILDLVSGHVEIRRNIRD
jgi:hypothetical protein